VSDRAVIEATLEGGGKVASEAKKIGGALKDTKAAGEGAQQATGGAGSKLKDLAGAADKALTALSPGKFLGAVAGMGFVGAAVVKTIQYLGEAKQAAQTFQERTSGSSRRLGVDVGDLRATFGRLEVDTHQSADAQQDFIDTMARTAYTGRQSMESLRGLGREAKATGRELVDFAPVTGSLQAGLRVTGDVTVEIDKLRGMAERLGTTGGPQALLDSITALRPAFEQISVTSDQARTKVEAFVAALQKHMRPEQAQAVAGGAVGLIKSRALDIERITGKGSVLDEYGQVKDPVGIMKSLKGWGDKKYGRDEAAKRRAMINFFGPELGSMLASGRLMRETDEAVVAGGKAETAATQRKMGDLYADYTKSPEGKRRATEINEQQRDRAAGAAALAATDTYNQATDWTAAGKGLKDAGKGAVKVVGDLASEAGAGLSSAGKGAEGTGAAVSSGLSSAGKGTEGLVAAIQRGLADALKGAGLTSKSIGQEVAVAMQATPIVAKVPRNPNEPKGN